MWNAHGRIGLSGSEKRVAAFSHMRLNLRPLTGWPAGCPVHRATGLGGGRTGPGQLVAGPVGRPYSTSLFCMSWKTRLHSFELLLDQLASYPAVPVKGVEGGSPFTVGRISPTRHQWPTRYTQMKSNSLPSCSVMALVLYCVRWWPMSWTCWTRSKTEWKMPPTWNYERTTVENMLHPALMRAPTRHQYRENHAPMSKTGNL